MWEIDYSHIEAWLDEQTEETVACIFASLELLELEGPNLGRPLVDTIRWSSVGNLKELRPVSSSNSEIRILFAFDPERKAVLLLGGDKSRGKNNAAKWSRWYKRAIPRAERLFEEHLERMGEAR